jgi:hypothetical protein
VPITLAWQYTFRSGSDDNGAYSVATDREGNAYVAGDVGSGADARILQLNREGRPGWHFDFDGGNIDIFYAIVVTNDRVVAAGSTFSAATRRDLLVFSLSPSGRENWRYAPPQAGDQIAHGLASDDAGNLYVAAESDGRWEVLSLDRDGRLRWRSPSDVAGRASVVSVDASANVFVGGSASGRWRIVKLRPDRSFAWERRLDDRGGAAGIAATADGGVIVAGDRTTTRRNLRVEKRDGNGALLWEYEASSPAGAVLANAVALNRNQDVFVSGDIGSDWLVLSLDNRGRRRWHFTYDGGGTLKNRDQAFGVAFQDPRRLLVCGRIHPLPPEPPSLGPVEWRVAAYDIADQ